MRLPRYVYLAWEILNAAAKAERDRYDAEGAVLVAGVEDDERSSSTYRWQSRIEQARVRVYYLRLTLFATRVV